MKSIILGLATGIIMLLYGCSTVTLSEHLPEQGFSKPEIKKLCGTWIHDDGVLQIAQTDSGEVFLGGLEWKNNDFKAGKYRLYLTKADNHQYVSIKDDKKDKYLFAEFNISNGYLLVWGPDAGRIEQLINNKVLQGTIKKDKHSSQIDLNDKADYILKILSTEKNLFDYRNPVFIMKRLKSK